LGIKAIAPFDLPAHDAYNLQSTLQPMVDDQVIVVDHGAQIQVKPGNVILPPANFGFIALSLHRIELVFPFEARFPTSAISVLLNGLEGSGRNFLNNLTIKMLTQPGVAELFGIGMKVVLTKFMPSMDLLEGVRPGLAFSQFTRFLNLS
jgi:hypothetical protein